MAGDKDKLLIEAVCNHTPWQLLQAILKESGLPVSKGVAHTKIALGKLLAEGKFTDKHHKKLFQLYWQTVCFGEKTVKFEQFDGSFLQRLKQAGSLIEPEINLNTINFPFKDNSANHLLDSSAKLVRSDAMEGGIWLFFASLKSLTENIELDRSYFERINKDYNLPPELFDVKAKQKTTRQFYDIVYVDFAKQLVEYRLDTVSANSTDLDEAFFALKRSFLRQVRRIPALADFECETVNLFPQISSLYNNSSHRVCELGFTVSSVTHHEKQRSGNKDLRHEVFHIAGVNKVDGIDVFRVATRELHQLGSATYESELYLPGTLKMLGSALSTLEYALIKNCLTSFDYNSMKDSLFPTSNKGMLTGAA
ncbi:hypothetical protein [Aliagarivorans marinus]|uniref:hypothetical protein n=1 Tax=Aliagarivorans marinus TaxID=561965 RepID=UPI000420C2E7|nr:hypothetical protein [Aliagarivorans marinus]